MPDRLAMRAAGSEIPAVPRPSGRSTESSERQAVMTSNRSGWAYGDHEEGGEWLTILGSAHRTPMLHATRAAAEAALDEAGIRHATHMRIRVARVTEVAHGGVSSGYAYRIHEIAT